MKRFLMAVTILATFFAAPLILTATSEAQTCTGTSVSGCNKGGDSSSSSTATGGSADAKVGDVKADAKVGDVKADAKGGNAKVGDVRTGDNNLKTGDVKTDQSNQQKVTVPAQAVPIPAPNNNLPGVTQPVKPEGWVNTFTFKPNKMTYEQAERCASGAKVDASWDGGGAKVSRDIRLFWEDPDNLTMELYLGTAKAEDYERSSAMSVLCSAALRAMQSGANVGFVIYEHQPQTYNSSFGIGGVGGGSAVLQNGSSPRAIVGAVAPAIGSATAYVRGNLIVHIQSFCLGNCENAGEKEKTNNTSSNTPSAPVDFYPNG